MFDLVVKGDGVLEGKSDSSNCSYRGSEFPFVVVVGVEGVTAVCYL